MRCAAAALAVALLLGAALARTALAQTPAERLARGVRAYQGLDYDSAAAMLRAALESGAAGAGTLGDSDRVRALAYLAATEFFRENRDSAAAAFGRLVRLDPRYRPDQLVFPPEVSSLFQEVRLGTRAAIITAPPLTTIVSAGDRLVLWVHATSYHQADVTLLRGNGVPVRSLYSGGIGDSLQILWDGRTATGAVPEAGAYVVRVDSRAADGRVSWSVDLPLEVARLGADTLRIPPPPPDSLFLPERTVVGRGTRALVTGLAAAATAVLLPSLVAGGSAGMGERFAVAGALGVAGVVGFQYQRHPQPIAANIAANRALRSPWERQADSVRAENAGRLRVVRLQIRAGASRVAGAP